MKHFLVILSILYSVEAKLNVEWWKYTNIYEIILYSFKDSDGDGIGDLKGLISKLDHFVDIGVETLYLTPIYESSGHDMGYDITNFTAIDPKYGSMEDFSQLVKEMKSRGLKLLMDLVVNHSSDEHDWFKKSIHKTEPYTDYYVWINPRNYTADGPTPPNNWQSIFEKEGSCWTWNEKRQQFYYHRFLKEQPDLNFWNENVKTEVTKIMEFWLDKGISGFRLDASMCYVEDRKLREDNPWIRHSNQPESFHILHELRLFLDEYNKKHGGNERIFAAEAHAPPPTAALYYGSKTYPIVHFPFNYAFNYVRQKISAVAFDRLLHLWLGHVPNGRPAAWVTQDHDQPRPGTRICPEYRDIFTIITGLLPGIVHHYYGKEIGMVNGYVQNSQINDESGAGERDPVRLPMQWDDSINAGFSTNLNVIAPPNTDYYAKNVATQKIDPISHYNLFKSINILRQTETFKHGNFESVVRSTNVHIFWRIYEGYEMYIVVTNFDEKLSRVNLRLDNQFPKNLIVVATSINSIYKIGKVINLNDNHEILLRPLSSIVFSSVKNANSLESI